MQPTNPIDLSFSLLWPNGKKDDIVLLREETALDLDLDKLVQFFTIDPKNQASLSHTFLSLCRNPATISARLDIIDDLLAFPKLNDCIDDILPVIYELRYYAEHLRRTDLTELQEVVWRLRELENYLVVVVKLAEGFAPCREKLCSAGLRSLADLVTGIKSGEDYRRLADELPELLGKVNNIKSVTIGVNLNSGMIPAEATLVSINDTRYTYGPAYSSLFGKEKTAGIAPLHKVPETPEFINPLAVPLFKDIYGIMKKILRPISEKLKEFVNISSGLFVKLVEDFLFFRGAVKMISVLKKSGLMMCRPRLLDSKERRCNISGLYNINLAIFLMGGRSDNIESLEGTIIPNNIDLDDTGRIAILTGPNRGGKTTFLQALGLAHIMLQTGLYIPADSAEMSLVDSVYTHYPVRENLEKGTGRFGEEAQRIAVIFNEATQSSLLLFNETLSSTSAGESLYLAEDIVRVCRTMGVRLVFATHLHQLAGNVDVINGDIPGGSRVFSLVARIEKVSRDPTPDSELETIRPTFRIIPAPPEGQSYAIELASKYGISRKQLLEKLADRNIVSGP
ncbi:MAG: hypothetical protein JW904_04845 [Spirochaetales bacterium]|nr:hypothetical protein [Spirochaetales bacterium]